MLWIPRFASAAPTTTAYATWSDPAVTSDGPSTRESHAPRHAAGCRQPTPVVTLATVNQDLVRLQTEVLALQQRLRRLIALLRLVVILWKLSASSLNLVRLLNQDGKRKLVQAIEQALSVLPPGCVREKKVDSVIFPWTFVLEHITMGILGRKTSA